MNLQDFLNIRDLAGFRIYRVYYATLPTGGGLLETFPVIDSQTKSIAMCLKRSDLISIIEKLPPRCFEIYQECALVRKNSKTGVLLKNFRGSNKEKMAIFRFLNSEEVKKKLSAKRKHFRWTKHIMSEIFKIKPRAFRKMIEEAKKGR